MRRHGDKAGSLGSDGDPAVAAAEHEGARSRGGGSPGLLFQAPIAASLQWKARSALWIGEACAPEGYLDL